MKKPEKTNNFKNREDYLQFIREKLFKLDVVSQAREWLKLHKSGKFTDKELFSFTPSTPPDHPIFKQGYRIYFCNSPKSKKDYKKTGNKDLKNEENDTSKAERK